MSVVKMFAMQSDDWKVNKTEAAARRARSFPGHLLGALRPGQGALLWRGLP